MTLSTTRRSFLTHTSLGLGSTSLGSLLNPRLFANSVTHAPVVGSTPQLYGTAPTARRVIYLFQSGGPSQLDMLDYKPRLQARFDEDLPDSIRMGQRITGMVANQTRLPVAPSIFKFSQHGSRGAWVSELIPHTARVIDDICVVHSMYTEAINHDPAITFLQTGSQQPGRPSMGAWIDYGLGSESEELPAFVVLASIPKVRSAGQGLLARLWGSGFLPSRHQGVKLRGTGDPVLYLSDPEGIDRQTRREMLDGISSLNRLRHTVIGDPEIETRIKQYEMAFRMQASVPELLDLSDEPEHIIQQYGEDARQPGTYARNCLLARRLAERGVRFIQLYHRGWDQHGNLPEEIASQCGDTDQATAALILDLKQRGMLDDTLVIWGGEFGRTVYSQGKLTHSNFGRDHHGRCFTTWMAGGGVKAGIRYGASDDYSFNITRDPVHIHDLQATILHCLGIDHEKLVYRFAGRDFRLTDVHGNVVRDILV